MFGIFTGHVMKKCEIITENVYFILDLLEKYGHETRIVGGAVRNSLLNLPISDIDIATTALPQEVIEIFKKNEISVIPTGIEYGTVTVIFKKIPYEITTLREDIQTFGRKAVVKFTKSFEKDSKRRDFTINAIYMNKNSEIFDFHHGLNDISARNIRFIGNASERIREDYLRILRYYRFVAKYGEYRFNPEYLSIINNLKSEMHILSSERIIGEFLKIFEISDSYKIIKPMRPVLEELFGFTDDPFSIAQTLKLFSELSSDERFALLLKFSHTNNKLNFPKKIRELSKFSLSAFDLISLKKQLKQIKPQHRRFFITLAAVTLRRFAPAQPTTEIQNLISQIKNFCDSGYADFNFRAAQLNAYNLSPSELKDIMIATKNYWQNSADNISSDDCLRFAENFIATKPLTF